MGKRKMFAVGSMMILIAMIAVTAGFAAEWPQVLEQIKANQVKFVTDIKDIKISQEMTTVTPDGKMVAMMTTLQKGKKFRNESTMDVPGMPEGMGPMKSTIIFDGKNTWMIAPMMGKKKLSAKESLEQQKDKNWWDFVTDKATITGKEKVGGRECYVVDILKHKDAPFSKIWLDEKNLVPMRMQKDNMITEFSDYKKVKDAWEMPYKITMSMDGKIVSTILVKSLEVNKGIADDQFDAGKVQPESTGFSMGNMMKEMMK